MLRFEHIDGEIRSGCGGFGVQDTKKTRGGITVASKIQTKLLELTEWCKHTLFKKYEKNTAIDKLQFTYLR